MRTLYSLVLGLLVVTAAVLAMIAALAWWADRIAQAYGDGCLVERAATEGPAGIAEAIHAFSVGADDVGLQVAVADRAGKVHVITAGAANADLGCPVTPDHLFLVGSVSKLVTATLVMRLVDLGALRLDAPAGTLADLPLDPRITVHHLLGHRSGLADYTAGLPFGVRFAFWPDASWEPRALTDKAIARPLQGVPGETYAYANVNFLLLGIVIEEATGRGLAEATSTLLAGPLRLMELYLADERTPHARIAHGIDHDILPLGPRDVTAFRTSHLQAAFSAGGIVSDAADLARLGHALFGGEILRQETLAMMMRSPRVTDPNVPRTIGYGLGLRRMLTQTGAETYGHTGTIPGYTALLEHDQELGVTLAVLANRSVLDLGEVADSIWQILAAEAAQSAAGD